MSHYQIQRMWDLLRAPQCCKAVFASAFAFPSCFRRVPEGYNETLTLNFPISSAGGKGLSPSEKSVQTGAKKLSTAKLYFAKSLSALEKASFDVSSLQAWRSEHFAFQFNNRSSNVLSCFIFMGQSYPPLAGKVFVAGF